MLQSRILDETPNIILTLFDKIKYKYPNLYIRENRIILDMTDIENIIYISKIPNNDIKDITNYSHTIEDQIHKSNKKYIMGYDDNNQVVGISEICAIQFVDTFVKICEIIFAHIDLIDIIYDDTKLVVMINIRIYNASELVEIIQLKHPKLYIRSKQCEITFPQESEKNNIEYKKTICDCDFDKIVRYSSQMERRILQSKKNTAKYIIGIMDSGEIIGLTNSETIKSIDVFINICDIIGASITIIDIINVDHNIIIMAGIKKNITRYHNNDFMF